MIDIIKSIFFFLFDIAIFKKRVDKGKSVKWFDIIISPSIRYSIIIALILILCFSIFRILTFDYFKTQNTIHRLDEIKTAIEKYESQTGAYPRTIDQLIGSRPLRKDWGFDAWGNPIVYTILDKSFELLSAGKDGKVNTEDDIILK
ncbi:type II secretion system protein GspG [Fulvivirga lutimaris]|uniref:type II secretion system protein GspG n=1 Tax=Fulvivirga lutimaris TaxID=1819566 RepID=UPI0012BBE6F4|nr:type II secretion system protein GspG [Fulvivirga lutimaris]MTI39439.1 hypothetical protein [Fulvivirga lutimaris]